MGSPDTKAADYRIVLVEPVEAPAGLAGTNWYRYVIDQGENRIYGYRQDSRQGIMQSVEELVLRLNARRIGPKGRDPLDTFTKDKPAAAK